MTGNSNSGRRVNAETQNVPLKMEKHGRKKSDFIDTPEQAAYKQKIYDYWNQGYSAGLVASKINDENPNTVALSRNAVIGLISRRKEKDRNNNERYITRISDSPIKRNNRQVKNENGEPLLSRKLTLFRLPIKEKSNNEINDIHENVKPTFTMRTIANRVIEAATVRSISNIVVPESRKFVTTQWVRLEKTNENGCKEIKDGDLYCNLPCCNTPSDRKSSYCKEHYIKNSNLSPKKNKVIRWKTF